MTTTDLTYPPVIGLAGRMGAGKDLVAAMLGVAGYERRAFADALREEVGEALQEGLYEGFVLMPDDVYKAWTLVRPPELWHKPTSPQVRCLLQWWGTEYRRAQDPDYWIRQVMPTLRAGRRYVISDVRFPNEADAVRRAGGVVWEIRRPGRVAPQGIPGHSSEALGFDADLALFNTGSVETLARSVAAALEFAQGISAVPVASDNSLELATLRVAEDC